LSHCVSSAGSGFLIGFILPLTLVDTAFGQTAWTVETGSWFEAANWSQGAPSASVPAAINNGGMAQIASAGAAAAQTTLATAAGQSGFLTVSGTGSLSTQTFVIGQGGSGDFSLTSGGTVTSTSASLGGNSSNGSGSGQGAATISGPDSSWNTSGTLTVGSFGRGSLTVDEGLVTANRVDLGVFGGSLGGISLRNGGTLRIGDGMQPVNFGKGGGEIRIGDGAMAGSLEASAVNIPLANGTIAFNHTNDIAFTIPITGKGQLTKSGAGTTTLNGNQTYSGTTIVQGGVLRIAGSLTASTSTVNGGTLAVYGSAPSGVTVNSGGVLDGAGTVGPVVINAGGAIAVRGEGVGTLTTGDLTLAATSRLEMDLGLPVLSDKLQVNGSLILDGTLKIQKTIAYEPGQYTILSYTGSITNRGLVFEAPFLAANPGSTIVNDAANKRIVATIAPGSFLPGDFDENGVVDGDDLDRWREMVPWPSGATHFTGDGDGDHDVDGADYLVCQRQVGQFSTATVAATRVPEPAFMEMLMAAFVTAFALFKRGSRGVNFQPRLPQLLVHEGFGVIIGAPRIRKATPTGMAR
jgi:autotransporter-associated beta strand protein/T5SS/PEP-CTERM-associated repeat protein